MVFKEEKKENEKQLMLFFNGGRNGSIHFLKQE
jgi:hypothetical protein